MTHPDGAPEQRLQAWGRWAGDQAGEVPTGLHRAPAERRWLPATAAAVVLVAAGAVLLLQRGPATSHNANRTASQAASGVVPWADLPPGGVPAPAATATLDPSVPLCRADHVRVNFAGAEGGGGNTFSTLEVHLLAGATPCRLDQLPTSLTGVPDGGVRESVPLQRSPEPSYIVPILLSTPADTGRVALRWYSRCDTATQRHRPVWQHVQIGMGVGLLDIQPSTDSGAGLALGCLPSNGAVLTSRFGGDPVPSPEPPDPLRGLTVALHAPPVVRAGTILRYTLTLTNPGRSEVVLRPCPDFVHVFDRIKDRHRLNCGAAQPIPAGKSEVFAIELRVPADAPSGQARLSWISRTGTIPAPITITITDGQRPTGPPACAGDVSDPVCGRLMPGNDYPYRLSTGCGVRRLVADGRGWRPESGQNLPIGNPPAGLLNPFDAGFLSLGKDGSLRFTSSTGTVLRFRPERPTDPRVPTCR